jgi:hypothetical protein
MDAMGTERGCFDIREANLGTNGLDHGARNFYGTGPTPLIAGWFAGRMWKNNSKLDT